RADPVRNERRGLRIVGGEGRELDRLRVVEGHAATFLRLPMRPRPRIRAVVNNSRTRKIRTKAPVHARSSCCGNGLLMSWKMKRGSDACGWEKGLAFSVGEPKDVMISGAVSPTARATPRMTAVISPARAVGRTTPAIVRHCDTPRASDAS